MGGMAYQLLSIRLVVPWYGRTWPYRSRIVNCSHRLGAVMVGPNLAVYPGQHLIARCLRTLGWPLAMRYPHLKAFADVGECKAGD